MSALMHYRRVEAELTEAKRIQKEALEDWRRLTDYGKHASTLFTYSVRVAVATHNVERLSEEWEDALADLQRERLDDLREKGEEVPA